MKTHGLLNKSKFLLGIYVFITITLSAQKNDLIPQENAIRLVYNTFRSSYIDTSFYNHKIIMIPEQHFCKIILDNISKWNGFIFSEAFGEFYPYEIETKEFNVKDYVYNDTMIAIDDITLKEETILTKTEPNYHYIADFEFIEDWYFDADEFKMQKNIIGFSPIEKLFNLDYMTGEEVFRGIKRFLYIQNSNEKASNLKLLCELEYEFSIVNDNLIKLGNNNLTDYYEFLGNINLIEKENSPLWTSFAKKKFMKTILDKVLDGSIKAYDYYSKEEIDNEDLFYRLGGSYDSLYVIDPDTEAEVIQIIETQPQYTDFQSVIFKENLYWDENKHRFEKKVISVSPVLKQMLYDSMTGDPIFKGYKVACEVFFNE